MDGWFATYRKIFRNTAFKKKPDRLYVFLYLLSEARIEPEKYEMGPEEITIDRGQVVIKIRHLADAVGMSKTKITRILGVLKTRKIVRTLSGTHGTLITICNYETYQHDNTDTGTNFGTRSGQGRYKVGTHINKEKNLTKKESTDSESLQPTCSADAECSADADRWFAEWWSLWVIKGTKRSKKKSRTLYLAVLRRGEVEHAKACDSLKGYMVYCHKMGFGPDKIKHPTTWLNAGAWDDELVISQTGGNGHGKATAEQLAERVVELNNFGKPDKTVPGSDYGGEDQKRGGQERSGDGSRHHGRGLPEIPAGFDQGDGGWLED